MYYSEQFSWSNILAFHKDVLYEIEAGRAILITLKRIDLNRNIQNIILAQSGIHIDENSNNFHVDPIVLHENVYYSGYPNSMFKNTSAFNNEY